MTGCFMRRLVWPAGLTAALFAGAMAASGEADAAWFERHACAMPARAACGGCAVSCRLNAIAVCRAGMGIWRGAAWTCSFQPVCTCQRSLWEITR
jgi:hypothetical protein